MLMRERAQWFLRTSLVTLPAAGIVGLVAVVAISAGAQAVARSEPVALEQAFWEPPWVWSESRERETALPAIDGRFGESTPVLPFHFDDGSVGRISVQTQGCGPGEHCAPDDCGQDDNVRIDVQDSADRRVAEWRWCAAYGAFSLVPVDLVDGPGDELVFVARIGRGSPPTGLNLSMWSIQGDRLKAISDTIRVADYLSTRCGAVRCVRWETRLVVEEDAPKPRVLRLRARLDAPDGAAQDLDRRGRREATALRNLQTLVFRRERYRLDTLTGLARALLSGRG